MVRALALLAVPSRRAFPVTLTLLAWAMSFSPTSTLKGLPLMGRSSLRTLTSKRPRSRGVKEAMPVDARKHSVTEKRTLWLEKNQTNGAWNPRSRWNVSEGQHDLELLCYVDMLTTTTKVLSLCIANIYIICFCVRADQKRQGLFISQYVLFNPSNWRNSFIKHMDNRQNVTSQALFARRTRCCPCKTCIQLINEAVKHLLTTEVKKELNLQDLWTIYTAARRI